VPLDVVAPLEMKEGTTLGARAQSAIERAAVLYKPRLATFNTCRCRGPDSTWH
jgi:hypothetical protein